jgi:hypothetical protein
MTGRTGRNPVDVLLVEDDPGEAVMIGKAFGAWR